MALVVALTTPAATLMGAKSARVPLFPSGVRQPQAMPNTPLPDIRALLTAVQKHQRAIDREVEDYACTKTVEQDGIGGHAAVKSRKTSSYNVFYLDGHEIDTLIAKDGKPLSGSQQAKENQRVRKQIEKIERNSRRNSAAHHKDFGIATFLQTSRFTYPRWERYRARPVVVFDFRPNPSYKPRNLTEKLAHSLNGIVWVDPRAQAVVRLQAWLSSSVKLAAGLLATLKQGSAFTFEQAPIENQLWMPSYGDIEYSGRVFLFKGVRGKIIMHYSDYRKFHVSTIEKIAPVRGGTPR
jgi:hypothetical protein